MHALWLAFYILVALLILLIVLIQGGENVDITAAFGGVSQAAFGPRGTVSTLEKITWGLGAIFLALSIVLSVSATKAAPSSVLQHTAKPAAAQTAPAKPQPKNTPAPALPGGQPFQH
jgi:preprotein translocase subunit SecG